MKAFVMKHQAALFKSKFNKLTFATRLTVWAKHRVRTDVPRPVARLASIRAVLAMAADRDASEISRVRI